MMRFAFLAVAFVCGFGASAALAASADDFNVAYAKAEGAEKQAVQMKTSWTTTVSTLKSAKQAADAGKFGDAIALAQQAEALANASVAQAKDQQEHWRDGVLR
jgi:hypothetical protein